MGLPSQPATNTYGNASSPLAYAAKQLFTECLAEMLRLGADPRHANSYGWTALHWVAAGGDRGGDGRGVVRMLVGAGCDAAAPAEDGRTAAEVASDLHGARWAATFNAWVAEAAQ